VAATADAAVLPRNLSPWGMFVAAMIAVQTVMVGLAGTFGDLDDIAARTLAIVRRAQPLPSFPPELSSTSLGFTVLFRLSVRRECDTWNCESGECLFKGILNVIPVRGVLF
jgi:hypothetical protein